MKPPASLYIGRVTVLEGIQKSAEFLAKKEVDSPRLHAELLLAHVLKLPRMQLYLNFERVLTALEVDEFRELMRRRGRREPLQHIIGSTSFCGLEITVNRHALIPRPETELLAEAGWQFLSQFATTGSPSATAFDFGTGSGCIAIALAVKSPAAHVYAADISPEALDLAARNAAHHHVADRVHFLNGDGFMGLPEGLRFDLVVSNPPYIPSAEIGLLQPEVRDFDPRPSLDGGADGLDYFRRLAAEAPRFLRSHGRLMLEFGDGQAGSITSILENQKWVVEAVKQDYTQHPRFLVARLG